MRALARVARRRLAVTGTVVACAAGVVTAITATARAQRPAEGPGRPASTDGQATQPVDSAALVRCVSGRPLPCVRVHVRVPAGLGAFDPAREGAAGLGAWHARLGPYRLAPVRARVLRGGRPRVVLTLVDVSGSMATNGGMQVARAAVRSFVRDLGAGLAPADSAAVRAGIAAFASRDVVAGVRRTAFVAPAAAAGAADRLPAPAGNTGLYAAVIAGAERVTEAARELGSDAQPALVVVTDGRNDVVDARGRPRPGDDPALATGADGRAAAVAAARRLGVPIFLVGVGAEPDMDELRALAGDRGLAFRTAVDAVALREALAHVDEALTPAREVVFAAPGVERATLARPDWPIDVVWVGRGAGAQRRAVHWAGRWPAPLLSAPVFAGAAFGAGSDGAAGPPPWLRAAADAAPDVGRRGVVALFVSALLGAVWWLPRALWRPALSGAASRVAPAAAPNPAFGAAPAVRAVRRIPLRAAAAPAVASGGPGGADDAPGVAPGGVHPDVREAPPRRPADVTAAGARRRESPPSAGGRTFAVHDPNAPLSPPGALPAGRSGRPDFDPR